MCNNNKRIEFKPLSKPTLPPKQLLPRLQYNIGEITCTVQASVDFVH